MTINSTAITAGPYSGNGSVSSFHYGFKIFNEEELDVYLTHDSVQSIQYLGTHYSVTNVGHDLGGDVVFITPPASGDQVFIRSNLAPSQLTDFDSQGGFYPEVHEDAFDKVTLLIQQLYDKVLRSLRIGDLDPVTQINPVTLVAGNYLQVNGTADGFQMASQPTVTAANGSIVNTFADLAITSVVLDQIVSIKGHTTKGIGDGDFIAKSGTVTTVSGIRVDSATVGLYLERIVLHDIYDPWMTGATGVKAADEAAILVCINEIKNKNRGTLVIPPKIAATAIVPAPGLGNGQSITIIDMRADRTGGVQAFGIIEYYLEGRDGSGQYATELRLRGKQNPGFSMYPQSDGTAPGYPYANNMTSIVGFNNAGENNFQILTDPYAHGRKGDFAIEQYAQGAFNVSIALYGGVDLNNKTRFDFSPILLSSANINISSITNTTPIVINTATPHGINAQVAPVAIVGTGITALDGTSWIASITGANQVTLLNSVASGVGGASGTLFVQKNSQRATINVPAIQGGTEAGVFEGKVVATGTNGQFVSEVATGTPPLNALSTTPCPNVNAHPLVYNTSGTQQVNCHKVKGFVALVAGTATVTLTGSAVFTADSSFNTSAVNHTAARAIHVVHNSGTSVTFNGTGTDVIGFTMEGN